MSAFKNATNHFKEFKPTTWSINNRTFIYLLILFVSFVGIYKFNTLPKEQFPDIVIPTIYVQSIYVGNSPKDIENLVTRPIEKQIKSITGAKINKFNSTSQQDFSSIVVEFSTDVPTTIALQKVKDAVDKATQDLPKDLTQQPIVLEVSFSEQPVMYVNISGDYDLPKLKYYAEELKDRFENLTQLNRVDIVGSPEREFQINVDKNKMLSSLITYDDISNTIQRENLDLSGGLLQVGNMNRNLQIKGQLKTKEDIEKIILRNAQGSVIYLKDIANIKDTSKEKESFARLDGKNVITLNIIKRSGENLIETSELIHKLLLEAKKDLLPKDLTTTITGDQSIKTKTSFKDLVNSIVIGFILVLIVLMFFMGVTNAFFVALSVPLSMFVALLFIPAADIIVGSHVTLNFIVLFALLFGLGIIVDDAIVVIENTHRIFAESKGKIKSDFAARIAAGEVFVPVLSGTITTLAPFFPLLFWPGIIGKFMVYLPTMLIFTLSASLIVAFIMNPVFAVDFMNHEEHETKSKTAIFKSGKFWLIIVFGILLNILKAHFLGNLILFFGILIIFNIFVLKGAIHSFQNKVLPAIMHRYEKLLNWSLTGWHPVKLLWATIGLLVISFILFMMSISSGRTKVEFFPKADPNQIFVYLKLPVGTDVEYTDSITKQLEQKINAVLEITENKKNPLVESIISNVAIGANDPTSGDRSTRSELGRIQINFVEFEKREGHSTLPYLDKIRAGVKDIQFGEISVTQEQGGPPTDPPINIEVRSEDFDKLTKAAFKIKSYLESFNIKGVEELKLDIDLTNPELTVHIDRERALIYGISTGQIATYIRTSLFGKEVSKIKEGKDEYKIMLRNNEKERNDLSTLLSMQILFRDFASGGALKSIPLSAVINIEPTNTLGAVKRKDNKRTITIRSNLTNQQGVDPRIVNASIKKYLDDYKDLPDGVTFKQTGENQQQLETLQFLGGALVLALMLILITLVIQFNSISKTIIILSEIIFSIIGVFLGFAITGMNVSGIMTGLGIVGLAGIVVKNGILVIEFTEELRQRGYKTREAVIQAGKTRIIPVMLTAIAAILGFIPIAFGFNINFITLFSELNPHIFLGGDSVAFWKPLSWTLIFGLAFAFFMTLIIVPAMYLIAERLKRPMQKMYGGKWISYAAIPPFTPIFLVLMTVSVIKEGIRKRGIKDKK